MGENTNLFTQFYALNIKKISKYLADYLKNEVNPIAEQFSLTLTTHRFWSRDLSKEMTLINGTWNDISGSQTLVKRGKPKFNCLIFSCLKSLTTMEPVTKPESQTAV